MKIFFPEEYPTQAPRLFFNPPLFHPNVYPSGEVCSSMLNSDWKPTYSIADLLLSTQQLLAYPHPSHPAQAEPFEMFTLDRDAYEARVRELAKQQCFKAKCELYDNVSTEQKYLGMDVLPDENSRREFNKKSQVIELDLDENAVEN